MKTTVNTRIVDVLKSSGIDELELASRIGKHPSTVYRIINGENEPSRTTVKLISEALHVNYDWLLTGIGDKKIIKIESENPWKDALVSQVKEENTRLEKECERLWKMIEYYTSGAKPNFLKALGKASAKVIPLAVSGANSRRSA